MTVGHMGVLVCPYVHMANIRRVAHPPVQMPNVYSYPRRRKFLKDQVCTSWCRLAAWIAPEPTSINEHFDERRDGEWPGMTIVNAERSLPVFALMVSLSLWAQVPV